MGNIKEAYEIMGDKAKVGRYWFGWVVVFIVDGFFHLVLPLPMKNIKWCQHVSGSESTKGSDTSYNVYIDVGIVATGCCRCSVFTWVGGKSWEFQWKEICQEILNTRCTKKFQTHQLLETGRAFREILIPPLPSYELGNLKLGAIQREEMWKQKFPLNGRVTIVATPVIMKLLSGGEEKKKGRWNEAVVLKVILKNSD